MKKRDKIGLSLIVTVKWKSWDMRWLQATPKGRKNLQPPFSAPLSFPLQPKINNYLRMSFSPPKFNNNITIMKTKLIDHQLTLGDYKIRM